MHFSVLGPLRVTGADGQPIEIRGVKERTLLAHLVARVGRTVPAAELIESLWGDAPPRSAAKSLQTYVLRVRNALEPGRVGASSLLVTEGGGYRLAAAERDVDAARFVSLVELGRRTLQEGRADSAEKALSDALALWRGPAYTGFEDTELGRAESRRLEELRMAAVEDRATAQLEQGRAAVAAAELEGLVAQHPLRERLWGLLVLALYRTGRQGEALLAYDRARAVLSDELGVDPGPELRELHARVLAQDPALESRPRRSRLPEGLASTAGRLVGRESELATLRRAWARARSGEEVLVLVRAPAGAGASRLVAALAEEVAEDGSAVVVAGQDAPRTGLVVADHEPLPSTAPGRMVLATARVDAPVPPGAEVLDLAPLTRDAVREVVGEYLSDVDLDGRLAEVVDRVLSESGGWPAGVHRTAARIARETAARRVEQAVAVTGASSVTLAAARADLTDGVEALREAARDAEPADPDVCPWKGLESYAEEDAAWFAGRERLVAELVSRVTDRRLLGIVGASGSGKSSAVRAGLLAALAEGALPGSASWTRLLLRPGSHPMQEVARVALGARRGVTAGDLLEHLLRDEDGGPEGSERVVLVVDQLEEVWTACQDEGERLAFLDLLADLATDPRSPVTVVVAVRADFVQQLAEHQGLAGLLRDSTVLVGSPTPAEIRRAVDQPATRARLRLEGGLADTIVSDCGSEPGLLPLLSTALVRLWQAREGQELTYAAYVGLGGISGAIADLAEEVYGSLDEDARVAARMVLLRLAGPGEGAGVVRRRVPVREVEELAHPGTSRAVEALVAGRLLTGGQDHLEVAHEAVYREWPRLRSWLQEDAAGREVQRRLAIAAAEWDVERRDPALLWRGARLSAGLDVAELRPEEVTATERAFLDAGASAVEEERRAAEERALAASRQNRRLRAVLVGLAVVVVLALVAGLLAMRSRAEARASQVSAEAKRLAAAALNEEKRDVALLSAVEAVRMERDPETYGALLTLLAQAPEAVTSFRTDQRFLRMAVTADGSTVVLGENEPVLRGVDTETGEQRWRADVPDSAQAGRMAAAPRGSEVFVPVLGPTTAGVLLDGRDGKVRWTLEVRDLERAAGDAFSPWLFTGSGWLEGGPIVLASASHLFELDPRTGDVQRAVPWPSPVSPGETLLVWPDGRVSFGGEDGSVAQIFDPRRPGRGFTELDGGVLAVSPDARRIAVASGPTHGELFRIHDGRSLRPLTPARVSNGFLRTGAWSRDGSTLALVVDSTIRVLDGRTGEERRTVAPHSGAVMEVGFVGRDGRRLWSAARDGTAVGMDLAGEDSVVRQWSMQATPHIGTGAAASPLVAAIRFIEGAFPAQLLDSDTGRTLGGDLPMTGLEDCLCQVASVSITADGSTALGGVEIFEQKGQDFVPRKDRGHVVLWDTERRSVRSVVDLPWPVYGIDVSADGSTAVVQGRTGYALLDVETGKVRDLHDDLVAMTWYDGTQTVELSPDGRLAALARDAELVLVDIATGKVVRRRELPGEIGVLSLAWSGDGRTLVTGSVRGAMQFLGRDLRPVAPRREVAAGFVIDLERSPDGRTLASMGSDGDVRLWDTRTWTPYGKPVLDERTWGVLDFADPADSADAGAALRVLYEDGVRYEIETDPRSWVRAACRLANRELTASEWAVIRASAPRRATCDGAA